jgi:hypothetical protein
VPAAAKNTTAAVIRTFGATAGWTPFNSTVDGTQFLKMTYRIPAVAASQYVRLRGTNLPASVPFETDASGNPLADVYTNMQNPMMLRIPCTSTTGTTQFDHCPDHVLVPATVANPVAGQPALVPPLANQKAVAFDVAAWSDLWFYSNPIYVEVQGSTLVAGVK